MKIVLRRCTRAGVESALVLSAAVLIFSQAALAQNAPSAMLQQFQAVRNRWFTVVSSAANNLFALLALVEFAWSAALLLLEKTDLQGFAAGVVRRLMFIGGFYTLLQFGPTWIPAIIDSFEMIGQRAANSGPLAPSAVFTRGLDIAGNLFDAASNAGLFQNMGTALALVFAAILAFLAFVGITIQFIVAMVESYIVVGAGFIFLGFGGSRWTSSYVERYIALAVSVGVKILVLYLLIAAGMQVSTDWAANAALVVNQPGTAMSAWDIAGGALIFLVLCWQAPKLTSGVLGGSPTLSGGDLVATTGAVAIGGLAVAGLASAGVAKAAKMVAARGASMSVGQAAGIGAGGGGGAGGGTPSAPRSTGNGSGGSAGGSAGQRGGSGRTSSLGSLGAPSSPSMNPPDSPGGNGHGTSNGGSASPADSRTPTQSDSPSSDNALEGVRVSPPSPGSYRPSGSPPFFSIASADSSTDAPQGIASSTSVHDVADPLPESRSAGSRIGVAVARFGSGISRIFGLGARGFRRSSNATRHARYTIPHDVPPPPPPPPPMNTTEKSE